MTVPPGIQFVGVRHDFPRWAWLVLALILLLAGALRFTMIGQPIYELDEFWHAELSTGRGSAQNHLPQNQLVMPGAKVTGLKDAPPVWKIWTHMEETVHPPMYPIALRLWRDVLGEGMTSSRSLGATASMLSILLLFDIVRRMHGTVPALWSAAIFAVASPQIALARTLRGYSFGLMLILAVAWIVVKLIEDPNAHRKSLLCALALLTAVTMLTYYFTVFPLMAIGIYAIARLRGSLRWKMVVAMSIGAIIFMASWTPAMVVQRQTLPSPTEWWIHDNWAGHYHRLAVWAASLPLRMLFEPRNEAAMFAILGVSLYLVPIFLLRRNPRVLLWMLWLWFVMLPLLSMDLARGTKHVSFTRYTLAAGPPVFAMLAITMQQSRFRILPHALPAVAFIGSILSIGSAYEDPRLRYDELAGFIDQNSAGAEPIIVYSKTTPWYGNAVFLTLSHESKTYPWPIALINKTPTDAKLLADIRAQSHRAWIITEGETPQLESIVPGSKLIEWRHIPFVGAAWHVQLEN